MLFPCPNSSQIFLQLYSRSQKNYKNENQNKQTRSHKDKKHAQTKHKILQVIKIIKFLSCCPITLRSGACPGCGWYAQWHSIGETDFPFACGYQLQIGSWLGWDLVSEVDTLYGEQYGLRVGQSELSHFWEEKWETVSDKVRCGTGKWVALVWNQMKQRSTSLSADVTEWFLLRTTHRSSFLFSFSFLEMVSCNPGWPQTHSAAEPRLASDSWSSCLHL